MLRSYALTDIGRRRQLNQDYIYLTENPIGNLPNLFIVADGMGGHKAGDYASDLAVRTVTREVETSAGQRGFRFKRHGHDACGGNLYRPAFAGGERGRQQALCDRR